MALIRDFFAWLIQKAILLIVLVVAFTVVNFLWNALIQQEYNQESIHKLENKGIKIQKQILDLQKTFQLKEKILTNRRAELAARKKDLPNLFLSPIEYTLDKKQIELEEKFITEYSQEYILLARKLTSIKNTKKINSLEIEESKGEVSHVYVAFMKTLDNYLDKVLIIFMLIIITPIIWKAFWYYFVAKIFRVSKPIQAEQSLENINIQWVKSGKKISLSLTKKDKLIVKPDWIQQYPYDDINIKTKFFLKKDSPFLCYATGLTEMTEFSFKKEVSNKEIILGCNTDSQNYICAITLKNGVSITIKPSYVVGIIGNINIKTHWNLLSLHGWLSGKLRNILFFGEGTILISGYGGLEPLTTIDSSIIIEESMVIGYDSHIKYSIQRTETFWSFFKGKNSLFDSKFEGNGLIIKQLAFPGKYRNRGNPVMKVIDGVLSGVGKILGF